MRTGRAAGANAFARLARLGVLRRNLIGVLAQFAVDRRERNGIQLRLIGFAQGTQR